ncbi:uncharacterized protein EV154DRAFT_415427, partial [Mucor mucedo]|uniref:uncharacterized protein n=1 Tax=Mucor mucedo TaxID=29922 RepID=UPI00221EE974
LPFRVRWQDIKDQFRKAGQVIRADVALNFDNRSKGHGTVLFATIEDAQKAIDMFDNFKWLGRVIEVRGDRGFVDTDSGKKKSSPKLVEAVRVTVKKIEHKEEVEEEEESDDDCKQLFVGNLPFQCQWQDLKDLFKSEGHILRADVVLNFDGRSRGFGTVLFANHKDAKQAIEKYNGFEFHNRILRVHFDKFAASHQRFREHEESTFGQRQIHDPESIELLRQTYSYTAPQPYTAYTSPYTSYGGGLDMYQGIIQAQPSFAYYPSQYNNAVYNGGYNTQQWVQPPLMQYPNEELTSLSNSLDNIHLYNTPRNGDFSWTD